MDIIRGPEVVKFEKIQYKKKKYSVVASVGSCS